ncbi:MAG: hypothetical protein K0Q55_3000 [Verrucomicrobia bacterium]|jgi:hypothetical protein|nr:hypothetical protein [Verrucomicrobiota bacterium]
MQHALRLSFFAFLLVALVSPCLALMGIGWVTPKEAKELGIELRVTDSGPNAHWVELEFKPEGRFKEFQHVSLEIADGEKLLLGYTTLKETREPGKVTVRFMAGRPYVDKITLRIVTGYPSNYSGHDLRLKEFIKSEKAR